MTVGGRNLLEKYGTPIDIAIALLEGRIDSYNQRFVRDVCDDIIMAAAEARLRLQLLAIASMPEGTFLPRLESVLQLTSPA